MKIKCRILMKGAKAIYQPKGQKGMVFKVEPLLMDNEKAIVDTSEKDKRSCVDVSHSLFFCKDMTFSYLRDFSIYQVLIEAKIKANKNAHVAKESNESNQQQAKSENLPKKNDGNKNLIDYDYDVLSITLIDE